MKVKNLAPRHTAPVRRGNDSTIAVDANVIPSTTSCNCKKCQIDPLAGDDAE